MKNERGTYLILILISIVVPSVVGLLLSSNNRAVTTAGWISFLPHLHASINSLTTLLLITGFVFIKLKKRSWHQVVMTTCVIMGFIFLISYIVYHYTTPNTIYGDVNHDGILDLSEAEAVGNARNIYLLILLSHIVMAAMVVPFVLFAFYFALTDNFHRHKKIVKFALPVWLYVSITGVLVYLMIRPYY